MSAVIDTRQSFLDGNGAIVASGRLVVYKLHTTELADVYQDAAHLVPLANPIGLSSASWTSTQVYSPEDTTVELQAYQGQDESDVAIFSTVKIFDVYAAAVQPEVDTATLPSVDTIPALRALSAMSDGQLIAVKGYSDKEDSYVRMYIWSESSAAIDNGGTVISSTVSPTGRWLLLFEEGRLDIRAFGCIPGTTDINSQFRAACNWAATAHATILIPAGIYNLASSGTFDVHCPLDVQPGVTFSRGTVAVEDSSSWYMLRLHNPRTRIADTFAGKNVQLTIHGEGWEGTSVPAAAFSGTYTYGYSHGTARFVLDINSSSSYTWQQSCYLHAVRVSAGVTATMLISSAATVTIDHVEGTGVLAFPQSKTFTFNELRTSNVTTRVSYAMQSTTRVIHLDSPVVLHSNANITALLLADGAGTLDTTDALARLTGGYGGKPNFIVSTHGINVGFSSIDQNFFNSANGLVNTWNISTSAVGDLDMGHSTSAQTVTRSGTIKNGTVAGVTADPVFLENMTVTGAVTSSTLTARNSVLSTIPNAVGPKLVDCQLTGSGSFRADGGRIERLNAATTQINVRGGDADIIDCRTGGILIYPNSSKTIDSIVIRGGVQAYITFDATLVDSDGYSTAANVNIDTLVSGNVNSNNSSVRRWVEDGHANISIKTNKLSTYGAVRGTFTRQGGSTNGYGYISAPIFAFYSSDNLQLNGFSGNDCPGGPACVWIGGAVKNSPRSILCSYYGQSGSSPATGSRVNVSWNVYPTA